MLKCLKVAFTWISKKNMFLRACVSTHMHRKSKWGKMLQLLNLGVHKCSLVQNLNSLNFPVCLRSFIIRSRRK